MTASSPPRWGLRVDGSGSLVSFHSPAVGRVDAADRGRRWLSALPHLLTKFGARPQRMVCPFRPGVGEAVDLLLGPAELLGLIPRK
jgi:hypothetical protein